MGSYLISCRILLGGKSAGVWFLHHFSFLAIIFILAPPHSVTVLFYLGLHHFLDSSLSYILSGCLCDFISQSKKCCLSVLHSIWFFNSREFFFTLFYCMKQVHALDRGCTKIFRH